MPDTGRHEITQRLKRRTLVTGAAWALPTVGVVAAAPAMASSCQSSLVIDWKSAKYTRLNNSQGTYTVAYPGGTLILTVTANYGTNTGTSGGLTAVNPASGFGTGLNLASNMGSVNSNVVFTFSFNVPVSNVSFTLGDVDQFFNVGSGGNERVRVSCPAVLTAVDPTYITTNGGCGTAYYANPATPRPNPGNGPDTWGNVNVHYANPVSSFTVTESAANQTGSFTLFMSNMTLDAPC